MILGRSGYRSSVFTRRVKGLLAVWIILLMCCFSLPEGSAQWLYHPINTDSPSFDIFHMLYDPSTDETYLTLRFIGSIQIAGVTYAGVNDSEDYILMKLNATQEVLWVRQVGGEGFDRVGDIIFDDGNILLVGHFNTSTDVLGNILSSADGRIYLATISPNGDLLDIHQLPIQGTITSLRKDQLGNYYLGGTYGGGSSFAGEALPDPFMFSPQFGSVASIEVFVAKLTSDFSGEWIQYSNYLGCCVPPRGAEVRINTENEVVMSAEYYGQVSVGGEIIRSTVSNSSFIAKFSSSGAPLWVNPINNSQSAATFSGVGVSDMVFTDSGSLLVAGTFEDDVVLGTFILDDMSSEERYAQGYITELSPSGEYLWAESVVSRQTVINSLDLFENTIYIGGSFEGELQPKSISHTPRLRAQGFIGIFEPNTRPNRFIRIESSGLVGIHYVNRIQDNLLIEGVFRNDVTIDCLEAEYEGIVPFAAELLAPVLLEEPKILADTLICETGMISLSIGNFDPDLAYTWLIPDSVEIISQTANAESNRIEINVNQISNSTFEVGLSARDACGNAIVASALTLAKGFLPNTPEYTEGPISVCQGDQFTVSVNEDPNAEEYHWTLPQELVSSEDSLVTQQHFILLDAMEPSENAEISVFIGNSCGQSTTSMISVEILPKIELSSIEGKDFLCEDDGLVTFEVDAGGVEVNYHWSISSNLQFENSEDQEIITQEGSVAIRLLETLESERFIEVYASNHCFESERKRQTLDVVREVAQPIISVGECGRSLSVNTDTGFRWIRDNEMLDERSSQIDNPGKGTYQVLAENRCSSEVSEEVWVNPVKQTANILFPNVITPNGDGLNDTFKVDDSLDETHLIIFDRYGSKVYESRNYRSDWGARNQVAGTYFYSLDGECISSRISGIITVLK